MNVLQIDFAANNAKELFCHSLRQTGFAVLENHPINWDFINSIYQEWTEFFARDTKQKYLFNRDT